MTLVWVSVDAAPLRQFYADPNTARVYGAAAEAKHTLLRAVGTLSTTASGDNPSGNASLQVVLDNTGGAICALWPVPPIGARVRVYRGTAEVFAGTLRSLRLTAFAADLQVEA